MRHMGMELKDRIKALGLTQREFAELLGKSQVTISRQLNGLQGMKPGVDMYSFVIALEILQKHDHLESFLKAARTLNQ